MCMCWRVPIMSSRCRSSGSGLWNNRREDHGPFDIIGDVHGCFDELVELLKALGYSIDAGGVHAPDRLPGTTGSLPASASVSEPDPLFAASASDVGVRSAHERQRPCAERTLHE